MPTGSYGDQPNYAKIYRYLDTGKYHSPTCYFEAVNEHDYPSAGYAKLLYNTGSGWSDVSGATVSWSLTDTRVRSSSFSLISGAYEYKVQAYKTEGTYVHHLRVILRDTATPITKTEAQHDIGQVLGLGDITWQNFGAFWTNDAGLRDGSVTLYFEATFYQTKTGGSSASKTAYVGFRKDGTEDPPVVQVTTTETTPVRVRSDAFTPTSVAHYTPAAKHATAGYSIYISNVSVIVVQTSFEKTYVLRHLDFEGYKDTGDGNYGRHYALHHLDPGEYEGYDIVFKLNVTFKQALGGGSGLPKLPWTAYCCFTKDGNLQTSYQVSTTATYYVELFSASFTSFTAAEYDSATRQTDSNKTTVHKSTFIRLEIAKSAILPSVPGFVGDGVTWVTNS